ncbi:MAG: hypothetical protein PHU23_10045 [Dehalococcoidales bacterium]|nr:hypothetical protein [Dehalococcoidales bacterium]
MRLKRRWAIIAVVAVVVLVLTGVIGGLVSAQTPTPSTTPTPTGIPEAGDEFLARVAEILGIEQADLEAAVKQAAQEMQDERIQDRLDKLVEQGKLTQEQADEYLDWWQSRPDVPEGWNAFPGLGPRGMMSNGKMGVRGGFHCGPRFNANQATEPAATE